MGVGGAFGMPLAGWAADRWSLAVLFWVCAAVALGCVVAVLAFVPESPVRAPGRVDVVGALLMTAMLLALLVPVTQGNTWGWTSPRTLAPLAGCAVLAWVFGRYELARRDPVVDLRELRRRPILLTNICSMLASAAFFSTSVGTAAYVQAPASTGYGFGASVLVGGLCLLPMGAMMMLLSPASGRINGRFGPRATMMAAMYAVAAGLGARMIWTGHLWQVVAGTTVVGIGTGLAFMAMPALIMRYTPPERTAAANGINSLARSVGSAVASAATTALLAAVTAPAGGSGPEYPTLTAYQLLFTMCGACGLVAAVVMLGVPGGPGTRGATPVKGSPRRT
jgi:MFS family permease